MLITKTNATDAIELLTTDHENLRRLLAEIGDTTTQAVTKRTTLVEKIAREVRVHARIEEEIFYPAYHAVAVTPDDSKFFFEAIEEHGLVDVLLPSLESTDPATEVFTAKAKVLKDMLEHHADEEEDQMFPRASKLLGKERLIHLGAELETRRKQLLLELG